MKKYFKYIFLIIFSVIGLSFFCNTNTITYAQDSEGLTIELLGDSTIYLIPNSEYVELGATAYDSIDGDISDDIVINSSSINNKVEGTYTVSYTVTNSSSESKTINRTVIVDDNIDSQNYTKIYGYSGTDNQWRKVIETEDGNLLAIGDAKNSYNSYTYSYIVKYDLNMNVLWEDHYTYSNYRNYERGYDVIECDGKYIIVSCNSDYSNTTILVYDEDGTRELTKTVDKYYRYIKQINNEKFILLSDNGTSAAIFSLNGSCNYITLDSSYNSKYSGFVIDGILYYLNSNKEIIKYDYINNSSAKVFKTEYSNIYFDEYIYATKNNEFIVKLDGDFNEISRIELDLKELNIDVDNDYIVVRTNDNKFTYIDKASFTEVSTYSLSITDFNYLNGYIVLDNSDILLYGNNSSSCLVKKAELLKGVSGLETEEYDLYSNIDYKNLIDIKHPNITYYIQSIDYSEVNPEKAGIYNVYFTIKYIEDEIKIIQASKEIIINHKTSIQDGAMYNGSIEIDVEGAEIEINGAPYNYGDIYNNPGRSIMKITGINGYEKTVSFDIDPSITGVEDGGIYYDPVTPVVSGGDLLLDGEEYISGTEISTKGNHVLEIFGANALNYSLTNNSSYPYKLIDGVYTSTNKQGNSDSTFKITFNQSGTFEFGYWVSSEQNYDFLTIYKNGSQIIKISGQTSEVKYIVNVNSGDYLSFTYSHDSGGAAGNDAAYIRLHKYHQVINFTIEPTIIGVADGQIYYDTIYPQINAENMTLNGQPYNNEPITNCGNYELVITGTGGYTKTISFVIQTIVEGIEDEGIYEASVTPTFTKGTATLNGEPYISGTEITTPGYNTLIILGEDGYSVEYNFTINETIEGVENASVYTGSVTPVISGGTLKLNGEEYVSGTTIDVPGNYVLEIYGAEGYYKRIIFIVRPQEVNVVNGETYNHSVIPAISKGTLKLNGEPYVSGTILNESGNYTLQIIGENGYLEIINFTLKTGANVENGAKYVDEITLHFVGDATLNGENIEAGTTINKVGNYYLVLTDGGNTYTYNFIIEPDYSIFESDIIEEVSFEYTNATVELNNEPYTSNTLINEVGNYVLVVYGVNGYVKTIEFSIDSYCNIKNGEEFIDSIEVIVSGGNIQLDGETYTGSIIVGEIGNHKIIITGINGYEKTINFIINPTITGVEDYEYYFCEVTPTINSNNIKLNGDDYQSGEKINETGIYELVILGSNGYEKTINFIILPNDFEVKPNQYYDELVKIYSCDALIQIDGTDYIFGQEIIEYGMHTIKFIYNGGYSEYSFYILPFIEGVEDGGIYEESVVITTNYPYLLLNNNPYTSGEEITEIGNHVFVVKSLDGYDHTIKFTIIEKYYEVEDGGVYDGAVFPTIPNGTLELDGQPYTSGTEIKLVGIHYLTIYGLNGYEHTITFTILESTGEFENGGEYNGSVKITIPNSSLLLDGNSFTSGTTVNTVGYHTLTVIGLNGYEKEYNFTVTPKIEFNVNGSIVNFEEGKSYENASYIRVKVSNVEYILLNGVEYSSNTSIYNFGNYIILIYGTNDYVFEMNFTKEAVFSGVEDGKEYSSHTVITCNYAQKLELNGNAFSNGSSLLYIGNHILTAYGEGDYIKEVQFTIKPYFYTSGSTYMSASGGEKVCTSGARFRIYNSYNNITLDSSYYVKMQIDGEEYVNNTSYYYVGNHTLTIYGVNGYVFEVEFVLTPSVSNLSEGKENTAFQPTIYLSDANNYSDEIRYVLLDGKEYELNTIITEVGNHTLTIYGSNDYVKEYHFVILPTVSSLSNGNSYYGSVTPSINYCTLLLDGDNYISGTIITEVGNHVITVVGTNGYMKSYEFTITPTNVSNYENKTFVKEIYIDDILDCDIFVNDEEYTLGDSICTIGNNNITILGSNGYIYELRFTITEDPKLQTEEGNITFKNNFVANRMVRINIPYATLYIDGEIYENNSEYSIIGKHYLVIEGLNGYSKEYEFTIKDKVFGLVDGGVYESFIIVCDNAKRLTLNAVEIQNGYKVSKVGTYILVVEGSNGYVNSYTFTININISGVEDGGVYEESIAPTFNSDDVTLDGEPFISGSIISEVGYHIIVVNGADDYQQIISFLIKETVNGVENGITYHEKTNVFIDGKCESIILNDELVPNNFIANEIGYNYLTIIGTNGYEITIMFIIEPTVTGVEDGKTYNKEITIITTGTCSLIKLNNSVVSNTTTVNLIGNNIYVIFGINGYEKIINFTLEPIITGVENGKYYDGKVEISMNLYPKSIKLNNENISINSVVNNKYVVDIIGNNKLTFETIDGSTIEINFVIEPIILNIEDNGTYFGSVTPSIKGTVKEYKLNGVNIEVNSTINIVGYNTLTIVGINGYTKTINFTLEVELLNETSEAVTSFAPIFNGNGKVYLNGQLISENTDTILTITKVGYNLLEIKGENGYSKTYIITIKPSIKGVVDGSNDTSFNIEVSNECYVYVDNVLYGNKIDNYNVIGNHTLTIIGSNDYSYSIEFTVVENFKIEHNYNDYFQLKYELCNVEIDGNIYFSNSKYQVIGNHTLIVYGTNGYISEYAFCIIPIVEGVESDNIYKGTVTFTILLGNDITVDGKTYSNQCTITEVGNHTLTIYGTNGYVYTYEFTVIEDISIDDTYYTNGVRIYFEHEIENENLSITLDGVVITNNYECNILGTHKLIVYGVNGYINSYEFTINPSIKGIENNGEYQTSVSWIIGGNATIEVDGKEFNSEDSYSDVGNHTMRIYTDYGYEKEIRFTILPKINGVKDGEVYNSARTISVLGCKLSLNGKTVNNSITVTDIGYHQLVISGSNGFVQIINFTITEKEMPFENNGEYFKVVIKGIGNCELLLNGNKIENNTEVVEPGKHILVIIGVNGYSNEYTFIINFKISLIDNVIETNGGQIFVNGIEVEQGYRIKTIGNNKITLLGVNGYTEEKDYFIKENIKVSDGEEYKDRVLIEKVEAQVFIDGVEIFEDTYIDANGNHTIKIVGAGGYVNTINIKVINTNIFYTIVATSLISSCLIGFILLLVKRKKVI